MICVLDLEIGQIYKITTADVHKKRNWIKSPDSFTVYLCKDISTMVNVGEGCCVLYLGHAEIPDPNGYAKYTDEIYYKFWYDNQFLFLDFDRAVRCYTFTSLT